MDILDQAKLGIFIVNFNDNVYYKKIKTIRKTAYIRFDLSERLISLGYINLILSIILTVYLSGWTVFFRFFPGLIDEKFENLISFISVMSTITLLCLMILDYMADRSLKAKMFLDNAKDLTKIADDLEHETIQNGTIGNIKPIIDEYNKCIKIFPMNHSSEDNDIYHAKQNNKFNYILRLTIYYIKRIALQLITSFAAVGTTIYVIFQSV